MSRNSSRLAKEATFGPGDGPMTDSDLTEKTHQLQGAIDVLFWLKEEFAQWVEEAQDDSKREALENVLAHVEATEQEYRRRFADAHKHS
jgi:tRNA 2-selenouridine synthase SelU